jgi:hypothetical protein
MPVDIISSEIIYECLKEHGKGSLFFRTDGLQFEARRAQLRREYLQTRPETTPQHHEAILKAAVTPGMTKPEVTAAWGLIEEDTRTAFGHVTDDERAAYAYFTGFAVGESYALYFKDDVVLGVQQTEELVPPHERELGMRLAEETRALFYFYDYGDATGLTGCDTDDAHADWNAEHAPPRRREPLAPGSVATFAEHLTEKGLLAEYLSALERSGLDRESLSVAECADVVLKLLPYPPLPQTGEQKTILDDRGNPVKLRRPPEEWFWEIARGAPRQVAFDSVDGTVELVRVQWFKGGVFLVSQIPLRVNGISQFDLIKAEWQGGDPIPRFQRVLRNIGYRTVRIVLNNEGWRPYVIEFVTDYVRERYFGRQRLADDILAFTIPESTLPDECQRELWRLRAEWIYTDTLNCE